MQPDNNDRSSSSSNINSGSSSRSSLLACAWPPPSVRSPCVAAQHGKMVTVDLVSKCCLRCEMNGRRVMRGGERFCPRLGNTAAKGSQEPNEQGYHKCSVHLWTVRCTLTKKTSWRSACLTTTYTPSSRSKILEQVSPTSSGAAKYASSTCMLAETRATYGTKV